MAALSPGLWCWPGRRNHESYDRQYLSLPVNAATVCELIEEAVVHLMKAPPNHSSIMQVRSSGDAQRVVIWVFTKRGWLDVIELRLRKANAFPSCSADATHSTLVRAHSWSTGFFTLVTPCAPLTNAICCCIPFFDFGVHDARLTLLREEILRCADCYEAGTETASAPVPSQMGRE
uniref:Uncharacterized protein n=1 Tax=Haptolina ericina TaxID=156174 RepID=A0A7S3AM19_9EUKA